MSDLSQLIIDTLGLLAIIKLHALLMKQLTLSRIFSHILYFLINYVISVLLLMER